MTDTTFNRAKEIKSNIAEAERDLKILEILFAKNNEKQLTSEDIKFLLGLASKGNIFMNGVYNNDFRNLQYQGLKYIKTITFREQN